MPIFSFINMDILRLLVTVVFANKSLFFMMLSLKRQQFFGQLFKLIKRFQEMKRRVYKRDFKSSPIQQIQKLVERIQQSQKANHQIEMFLRSLNQQPESHWDSVVQERALQLSQTFSIDWNGDIDQLHSQENSQSQFDLSLSQMYHNPMAGFRLGSINDEPTINPRQIDRLQNRHNLSANALNIHFPSSQWINQSNNVFIISRVDHANEEDFLQAIDFLFQQLAQPKPVPKFRHIMNRMNSKCAICFGKIKRCQTICKTACRHKFHSECLEKWTERNPSCPLCRKEFK